MARVKATVPARVLDVSPFGAQVQVGTPLRPGVECDVTIPVVGGEMRVRAIVRRCRVAFVAEAEAESESGAAAASNGDDRGVQYRAGLEFVRCSEEEAARLRITYGTRDQPPAPEARSARRGPIKIRVDPAAVERRMQRDGDGER